MNRITAMTHSAVKIGFLCCLMMVLGTKIKAQNKGGYEKITIEETDPFGTKAIKDKKKINGSNSLASKHIEIVAKINPLLLFSGEYMGFGEIIFKERIGIEIGLGITVNNRLLQYPYLTGELKSSEIEQYYVLGAVNSDLYNSIPNSATPTINYSTGSAFRIEGRIYLGENNYNDAVGFLSLGYRSRNYNFSYAAGSYMPNQNSGDSSANASDMNMTLRISELLVGFGYNYPIDNHYRIEWYSNLGIRTVSLNVPMTEVKGMYTYKTIEEHPLNLGFGLKVGYSF